MPSIKVYPLHVGTITRQASTFCYRLNPGQLIQVPLLCWYIEGTDDRILVDTGGGDPREAGPQRAPYERPEDQGLENALRKFGLRCADINIVVVTHLHWDHCSGNGLFPNAKMIVQKKELESARFPLPVTRHGYVKSMVEDIQYTVISGDEEISKGVSAIFTPGHTYGMQGILVETGSGRIFLAGDTFGLFENLKQDPPMISGIYVDLKKYYWSIKKIGKFSALILPGHDFKVLEKEAYY